MNKKYIIFDLDGTLIYSQTSINEVIIDYVRNNFGEEYIDKTKYFLHKQRGSTIKYLLEYLAIDGEETKVHESNIFGMIKKIQNIDFIEGTIKKIKELKSDGYILYLSTGNSTDFAEKILKKGGIKNLFDKIMGSDVISKSNEHIEIFKNESLDDSFLQKTISVGDGQKEEEIAKYYGIDFVKIGTKYNSINQINFKKYGL